MLAYQTDETGRFIGAVECQPSPREPGRYLVPRGAVTVEPPSMSADEYAVWDGAEWSVHTVEPVVIEPQPVVEPWDEVRARRDYLLAASDWTQVSDAPVDAAAWAVYRQALRDVPQDFASPDAVVWPTAP